MTNQELEIVLLNGLRDLERRISTMSSMLKHTENSNNYKTCIYDIESALFDAFRCIEGGADDTRTSRTALHNSP